MEVTFSKIEGYAYGAIQPTAALYFSTGTPAAAHLATGLKSLIARLEQKVAPIADDAAEYDTTYVPALVCRALDLVNRFAGDQRFTPIQTLNEGNKICCLLPTLSLQLSQKNLFALIGFLGKTKDGATAEQMQTFFEGVRHLGHQLLPRGTNAPNLIAAAVAHKIPMKLLSNGFLAFGYGSGSVIFNSSITDQEKAIGVGIARSKVDTNQFLRLSGFPVVEQRRIKTLEHASSFAEEFGYPVVLKPVGEEKGRGVYANIQGAEDLAFCHEHLTKSHKDILIETHAPGDHYRFNIMRGKSLEVTCKRAPRIVGDGTSTIRALIERMNQEPERLDPASAMNPVAFDEELTRSLKNQNVALEDVPAAGQSHYLGSLSNGSRGGSYFHVEDDVHPANHDLAFAVARTMRVEVSGVDIISPDISKPWYSNGAVVCEVNAQPQLGKSGKEIYWHLLKAHLPPQVPVTLHVSKTAPRTDQFLYDTNNTDVTLHVSAAHILTKGAPTQYFDTLTIAEDVPTAERARLSQMLQSVQPAYRTPA